MGHTVSFDQEDNLVLAVITGELSAEVTGAAAVRGVEIARERGCRNFIVDFRRTVVVDATTTTFSFMGDLSAVGLERRDRIAIVYANDAEKHQFAETVAHNRGWQNIRYFDDMDEARAWLTSGQGTERV